MALNANNIKGDEVILSISTNLDTPAYLDIVCSIDNGLSMSRDITTTVTKCGTDKAGGAANSTITGSFVANTDPESDEMSADALIALMDSGDNFLFKMAHVDTPANYYRQGTGFFSAYNETANANDSVKGDFTIDVVGSLVVTAPGP
jgi:hypothetical protein